MKRFCSFFLAAIFVCFISVASARCETKSKATLKVLTANVGNSDIGNCVGRYVYKLCLVEREAVLIENIRKISPDIVALQEVFDMKLCEGWKESSKKKICHKYDEREPKEQARRLLGDDYTIVCDGGANFECIGVRKTLGEVKQCPAGGFCNAGEALFAPVPDGCNKGASISAVDVVIGGTELRIVNGHPQATGEDCRAAHLKRLFEGADGAEPLASPSRKLLIMGDMNTDPFRLADDPSIAVWNAHVGDGRTFRYLSGPAEAAPHYPTCAGRLLDHVITNFASGACGTLGEAPGTERLDGVSKEDAKSAKNSQEANDHRAILCEIAIDG